MRGCYLWVWVAMTTLMFVPATAGAQGQQLADATPALGQWSPNTPMKRDNGLHEANANGVLLVIRSPAVDEVVARYVGNVAREAMEGYVKTFFDVGAVLSKDVKVVSSDIGIKSCGTVPMDTRGKMDDIVSCIQTLRMVNGKIAAVITLDFKESRWVVRVGAWDFRILPEGEQLFESPRTMPDVTIVTHPHPGNRDKTRLVRLASETLYMVLRRTSSAFTHAENPKPPGLFKFRQGYVVFPASDRPLTNGVGIIHVRQGAEHEFEEYKLSNDDPWVCDESPCRWRDATTSADGVVRKFGYRDGGHAVFATEAIVRGPIPVAKAPSRSGRSRSTASMWTSIALGLAGVGIATVGTISYVGSDTTFGDARTLDGTYADRMAKHDAAEAEHDFGIAMMAIGGTFIAVGSAGIACEANGNPWCGLFGGKPDVEGETGVTAVVVPGGAVVRGRF